MLFLLLLLKVTLVLNYINLFVYSMNYSDLNLSLFNLISFFFNLNPLNIIIFSTYLLFFYATFFIKIKLSIDFKSLLLLNLKVFIINLVLFQTTFFFNFFDYNDLLLDGLNQIHPLLLYITVSLFFVSLNYTNIFFFKNLITTICLMVLFTNFLGSYWAFLEGNWGGWWNWDISENFSLLIVVIIIIMLHTSTKNNFSTKLKLIITLYSFLILFNYLSIQINFKNNSHTFTDNLSLLFLYKKLSLLVLFLLITRFFFFFNFFSIKYLNSFNLPSVLIFIFFIIINKIFLYSWFFIIIVFFWVILANMLNYWVFFIINKNNIKFFFNNIHSTFFLYLVISLLSTKLIFNFKLMLTLDNYNYILNTFHCYTEANLFKIFNFNENKQNIFFLKKIYSFSNVITYLVNFNNNSIKLIGINFNLLTSLLITSLWFIFIYIKKYLNCIKIWKLI